VTLLKPTQAGFLKGLGQDVKNVNAAIIEASNENWNWRRLIFSLNIISK
jgi:hypothetical protein